MANSWVHGHWNLLSWLKDANLMIWFLRCIAMGWVCSNSFQICHVSSNLKFLLELPRFISLLGREHGGWQVQNSSECQKRWQCEGSSTCTWIQQDHLEEKLVAYLKKVGSSAAFDFKVYKAVPKTAAVRGYGLLRLKDLFLTLLAVSPSCSQTIVWSVPSPMWPWNFRSFAPISCRTWTFGRAKRPKGFKWLWLIGLDCKTMRCVSGKLWGL